MSQLILPPKKEILAPHPDWAPLYYTKRNSPISRGEDVADFALTAMKATGGLRPNQPLDLAAWQRWAIDSILEEDDEGRLRYDTFLLGVPRKNGKSMIGTAIAMEALFFADEGVQIFSAARDRDQAKIVFNEAKRQIKNSRPLQKVLKSYRDTIENTKTGAIYKATSSDAMSFQGYNPYITICDELHGWLPGQAEDFWAAIKNASNSLPEFSTIAITTAGKHLDSLLGVLFEKGVRIANGEEDDDGFGMAWWASDDSADIASEETWKKANPNIAEGIMEMRMFRKSYKLASTTGKLHEFKRYQLNQWTSHDGLDSFMTPFHWVESEKPGYVIPKGSKICVGFDGSVSEDSTAFIAVDMATGVLEILACWERDYSNPDWVVPRHEVLDEQRRIFEEYQVERMWCDPAFFQSDVDSWAMTHKRKVERIPQSNQRMVPMTEQLKIDMLDGKVFHNGDHRLRRHFMNAVQDDVGKVKKEKRGSRNKIDFLVCAILANGARNAVLRRGRSAGRGISL
jgi:phage terminase large subunit-like protein